ncbi:MAG: hypothetical protein H6590_06580 [Flavobacteriales bacterium]|nr:hypothetical protein [Flavobacteriales bacterium]
MSETTEAQAQAFLQLLSEQGNLGNGKAQALLQLGSEAYEALREQLVAKGRGRGGSVQLTPKGNKALVSGNGLEASEPKAAKPMATGHNAPEPVAYKPVGRKAKGQKPQGRKAKSPKATKPQADKSLETWIWDAACSIRGEHPQLFNDKCVCRWSAGF